MQILIMKHTKDLENWFKNKNIINSIYYNAYIFT